MGLPSSKEKERKTDKKLSQMKNLFTQVFV